MVEERQFLRGETACSAEKNISLYWLFTEKFRGHSSIGKGDARAYISALTDITAIETGAKDVEGLEWALGEALKHTSRKKLDKSECEEILRSWRHLDRRPLKSLIDRSQPRLSLPKPERNNGLSVVSLFTGSYGLDLGFEYAGFKVTVGLDNDPASEDIMKSNRPDMPFIMNDIAKIPTRDILEEAKLGKGEIDVLTGGPPCQPFSTAGKRQGFKDPRASPLKEYIRVIDEAQPKAFVMEEVTGLLNARLKHVPIRDRNRPLTSDELPGSVWRVVLEELERTRYKVAWRVLNAADFGTPQIRRRVIIVGLRKDLEVSPKIPRETHVKPGNDVLVSSDTWRCLLDALSGVNAGDSMELPPKYRKYMLYVPPGGNWRQIPKDLVSDAMNGAFVAGGGRMGFYRRLSWFEPSPTLVTTPIMKGSMLIHPTEERPLSVNEYKVIQGFPKEWEVSGTLSSKYRKIGEAVPPLLAYAIALTLRQIFLQIRGVNHGSTIGVSSKQ